MPPPANESNPATLELEAELVRNELAHTIGELQSRLSPQAVRADMEDYVRSTGQSVYRNIETRARENPLATAAIAAGVAFPLFRLLTAIPVPVLLVGAGLALTKGVGTSGNSEGQTSKFLKTAQDRVESATQSAREMLHDATDAVKQRTAEAREMATGVTEQITSAAAGASDQFASAARKAQGGVSATASALTDSVRNSGLGADSVDMQSAQRAVQSGQDQLVRTIEQHPLIVGGIGLAIGAMLASMFPTTRAEGQVLGSASKDLQDRAKDLASEASQYAQQQASEILRDGSQGLSEKVRSVADAVTGNASDHMREQSQGQEAAKPALREPTPTY